MFTKSAMYYDKIYAFKDYRKETERLVEIISAHQHTSSKRLLDVACGTGGHINFLKQYFTVEGMDIDAEILTIARQHHPDVHFHQADMINFSLGRSFDVITCLFSSIGYVKTLENLSKALNCMARHLSPGGVLLIEPWFTPETWRPNTVHAVLVDEPELKIARINTSFVDGRLSYFDLHYLVGTPQGTEHFMEHHELGLFEDQEIIAALLGAGLATKVDSQGLTGRGLLIATQISV
jgi:ubiquinone/menaquinone biosynthesis C-methylase UbiE